MVVPGGCVPLISSYSVTYDEIIAMSLRKLGVLEIGETVDAATLAICLQALNLFVKQLSIYGLKLWKNQELTIPLIANQTVYLLGGATSTPMYDTLAAVPTATVPYRPLKIIYAYYRNTAVTPNIDVPVQLLSKQEYNSLGSKFATGSTNSIFYDVKKLSGAMYVYPTPDANAATNTILHIIAQLPLADVSTCETIVDFPQEWFNALAWNLADQLSLDYGVPVNARQEIAARAKLYLEQLSDFDVEAVSTYFQVDMGSINPSSYYN